MKKQFVTLLGVGLMLVAVGCTSRTRVTFGPLSVAGQTQAFETEQPFSFDLSPNKVGFTVGYVGWSVESMFGSCEEVIGASHATGDTEKVLEAVPALNE
ncbi:hypothetical protein LCGC14_0140760 [marine sediment metagenome]|uniref:Uncharacterized protein n=1 Tax=marine sediment metagenome TaxID=412755 RepID=A0A0F9V0U3_9ZZZZ